ncbi:hypothetical protein ACGFNU_25935 [Spirillospora sp. NPDC048911]|uniref:hypothetical protein n=1 Tax=Spirillospora sp. NPDC048911 TaxID=3364527 RepID=UPI00371AFBDB
MSEHSEQHAERRPRPRFDPGGVITGIFFLAVAGVSLATGFSGEPVVPLRFLVPAALIGLGLVGIIRVFTRGRRRTLR